MKFNKQICVATQKGHFPDVIRLNAQIFVKYLVTNDFIHP